MPGEAKPSAAAAAPAPLAGSKRPRSEPKAAQQLSGATRNMRFMQRNNSHSPKQQAAHEKGGRVRVAQITVAAAALEDTNETAAGISAAGSADSVASPSGRAQQSPPPPDGLPVVVERATPLDMYGPDQCAVLGRRSFGGFNPAVAENWHAQRQDRQAAARAPQRSDADLLRRYKDLAEGRHGNERQPRSGTKRRSSQSGISNQTKRKGGFDAMQL